MNSELPSYAQFGARETAPAPFECKGGSFHGFLLAGDTRRIKNLCRRMLNDPAKGEVEYRPLSRYVVMVVGPFAELRSKVKRFNAEGFVKETQLSLLLPLEARTYYGKGNRRRRLVMAAPYVFVDNPMSLLNGREEFGYAKALGRFNPKTGRAKKTKITVFGGDYAKDSRAGWTQLLQVEQLGTTHSLMRLVPTIRDVPTIFKEIPDLAKDVPDIVKLLARGDGRRFLEALEKQEVKQVGLKQFRDAADSTRACYQKVVEVPVRLRNVTVHICSPWHVRVTRLDSYPIGEELGVGTQTARLSFKFTADMTLDAGEVVAPL